jgi:hypothetical protein
MFGKSNLRSTAVRNYRRAVIALFSALLLLGVVGAATAVADEDGLASDETSAASAPPWGSRAAAEAAREESNLSPLEGPETDPHAAAILPHEDLDRGEAINLLTGVFGGALEQPSALYAGLDVRAYRSDYVAVTEQNDPLWQGESQAPLGLFASNLPLRVENEDGIKEAINLDLERSEGELRPQNPLVEVGLPAQIGEGISLPESNVTIELHGAPSERAASETNGDAAVYPNIADDSDLAVVPSPTGVETFTQLRSPDSPQTQEFTVGMPSGASLEETAEGGAEIRQGDSTLMRVRPPSAIDATGAEVPVSLDVDGDTIAVHASPTEASVYPILVDPIWESYYWDYYPGSESPQWIPYSTPGFHTSWETWLGQGLKAWSPEWGNAGEQASWNYYVPRYFTDFANPQVHERPSSYVREITFSDLMFLWASGTQKEPHLQMGLWSENKGNWVSLAVRWGFEGRLNDPGYVYHLANPAEVTDAKNGGVALATWENYWVPQRSIRAGLATAEISDKDSPAIGSIVSPTTWVNQTAAPVAYSAADPGLGVYQLRVEQPNQAFGMTIFTTPVGCDGSARNPCPRTVTGPPGALTYEPKSMPEGEQWLKLVAIDPITHQSPVSEFRVKVDHTAPGLTLSGTMTEQGTLGTQKAQYTVKAAATDGTTEQPRSGVAKIEIKVDGKAVSLDSTWSPGCATKNCALTREWTLNADQYTAGQHKVEVTATDAVGLATTKTLTIETHPDLAAPSVALSGSMTEQATLGTTRPSYLLKVNATDPGSAEERKSGVASTVVKVDGKAVDSYNPGCVAGGCTITREWTLQSLGYAVGAHVVQVTATDAAGKATTNSQTINIARDTTAPQISATTFFYTAPEGWVEQKLAYSYNATASDANGYGTTSLVLKIDGTVIKSVSQSCPLGSCSQSFGSSSIDMHPYIGGAHSAELAATDDAGNVARQKWTLNVDPAGQVSSGEAISTVEAMEGTTEEEVLASEPIAGEELPVELSEEELEPKIVQEGEDLQTIGAPTETAMTVDPGDGFTIHAPEGDYSVVPVGGGSTNNAINDDRAVIAPNTHGSVDSIVRPTYEGDMTFQLIRDASAIEEFSWRVQLGPEDTLTQVDSTHAEVFTDGTVPTLGIRAIAAHDADGSEVPTTLAVGPENTISLTVHHRAGNPAAGGAPFVYPISAGTGWLGGFQTFAIAMPAPEVVQNEEEEEGYEVSGTVISEWSIGAPEAATVAEANASGYLLNSQQKKEIEHRRFRYIGCQEVEDPVIDPGKLRTNVGRECGNPFARDPGPDYIAFNMAIRGAYFRLPGVFTKHLGGPTDHIECDKMYDPSHYGGYVVEMKYFIDPARKCQWWGTTQYSRDPIAWNENGHSHHITPYGEWNWGSSAYAIPAGHWTHHQTGLALYLWTTSSKYIGRHVTTCIDC